MIELGNTGTMHDIGGHRQMWAATQNIVHKSRQVSPRAYFYKDAHVISVHGLNGPAKFDRLYPVLNRYLLHLRQVAGERGHCWTGIGLDMGRRDEPAGEESL